MKLKQDILQSQPHRVQKLFTQWENYMDAHVAFWSLPGNLDIHTEAHSARVLLHALRIGHLRNLSDDAMTALAHTCIFHDTRRKDNYRDIGHGDRAAEYYADFCKQQSQENKTSISFYQEAYDAMKYHDRNDDIGDKAIAVSHIGNDEGTTIGQEIYHIFKDADALDRYRLGDWCLDERFLRTPESKNMTKFALDLVLRTTPPDELKKVWDLTLPFKPKNSNH